MSLLKHWDEKRNWFYIFKIFYGRTPDSLKEFHDFVAKNRAEMDKILFYLEKFKLCAVCYKQRIFLPVMHVGVKRQSMMVKWIIFGFSCFSFVSFLLHFDCTYHASLYHYLGYSL